jgi:hypothetical protein
VNRSSCENKPKGLRGLDQKVTVPGRGLERQPLVVESGTRSMAGTYPRVDFWSGTWKPRTFA